MLTVLAATPPTLGDDAFGGCDDLAIINVSAGSEDAYTNLGSYTITGKNLFLTPVSTSWTVEIGSDFDSQTFTITNVSSRQIIVSVALGGIDWGSFTLNKSEFTLAAGGTATFTVTPNTGLKQSTYTATVTVTATVDSESVTETANITFFVNPKSPAGAKVQVSGSYTYITAPGRSPATKPSPSAALPPQTGKIQRHQHGGIHQRHPGRYQSQQ